MRTLAVALSALAVVALSCWAEDEEPAAPTTPITRIVRVLRSEDAKPFANATVEAHGMGEQPLVRKTGADGVVRFDAVPRKGVCFVVRAPGRFCAWFEPGDWWGVLPPEEDDPDGDGVTTMEFELTPGAVLEGRVVATEGDAPVAGARVEAWERPTATDQFTLDVAPVWTTVTDAQGRFRVAEHCPTAHERRSVETRVTATADGRISETLEASPREDATYAPLDFRLRPAALLRGAVTAPDGTPAPGALVHAFPPDFGAFHTGAHDDRRSDENEHPRVLHVRTDASGRYAMPELVPGVRYFVYAEGFGPVALGGDWGDPPTVARSEVAEGVGVDTPGGSTLCDLRLRRLGSLRVRVARDAGGEAEHLQVDLTGPPRTRPWVYDDDAERGRDFREVDPGTSTLRVRAPGWLELVRTVEVAEGEDVEVAVRMSRGAAIEGVLVDDRGEAVACATVYAYPMDPADEESRHRGGQVVESDDSGVLVIRGLPEGPVDVVVSDDRYVPAGYVRLHAPSRGIRLQVVRSPRVRVTVEPPAGSSIPKSVRVVVTQLAGPDAGLEDAQFVELAGGSAELERVRPGPMSVTVDLPGFAPSTVHLDLAPGAEVQVACFRFEEGVRRRGRVVDADGTPVAGARLVPDGSEARAVSTAEDGGFELEHLASPEVALEVSAGAFPVTFVDAPVAIDDPFVVVLRPGGVVRGVFPGPPGDRRRDTSLCVFAADAQSGFVPHWDVRADADGSFRIRLPAGRYRGVATRYAFDRNPIFFDVTEAGETVLDLRDR